MQPSVTNWNQVQPKSQGDQDNQDNQDDQDDQDDQGDQNYPNKPNGSQWILIVPNGQQIDPNCSQ